MDLTKIESPSFLKDLSVDEMKELAQEIRSFLIQSISKTGGHLASNLGVVELTIALHYVFDSPKDKIFFDVGHQCYTHKILTGRADQFSSLRKYQGISGFEKRVESEHDVWEAGHSSTSLSAALGMAVARDQLNEDPCYIVPVIGDGALSSGMSLEALNSIGSEKRNMVVIFNDNNMSISKNVGAMAKGFGKLRTGKAYNNLKRNMKEALSHNEFGKVMYTGMHSVKEALKGSVIEKGIFGEFNLEYIGPVDGHNIAQLIQVLKIAKDHNGPVVVHVITQKGRGYVPCEKDREGKWHGVGPFDVATGKSLYEIPLGYQSWSELFSETLLELAEHDDRITALTPAMINGSQLEQFFAKYPLRSFDCGIAEEHTVTFAAGQAISGLRPFVSIYSSFLQRAYDQINHDVCRMDLPVVFGIDRAGLVGPDGETHHGVFDIGFLRPIPNLILAQPKDAEEARNLLYTAFNQNHPFAIRYPRGEVKESGEMYQLLPIGSWTVLNHHQDNKAVVMTYGPDVDRILDKILVNNMPVTVVNCRFFKPLDTDCINTIASWNLPVFIYETDMLAGGLSSAILEYCNDENITMRIKRFGLRDHYITHGSVNQLRKQEEIDLVTLMNAIAEITEKHD